MKYVIVDIDGTVALHVNPDGSLIRGHHEYDKVADDMPNLPVIALVKALSLNHDLAFVSGRPGRGQVYWDTAEWLMKHVTDGDDDFAMYMRTDGDFRPDDVVKEEMFRRDVIPEMGDDVLLAIDDRPRVIRMWERIGIYVIDVQPLSGEF